MVCCCVVWSIISFIQRSTIPNIFTFGISNSDHIQTMREEIIFELPLSPISPAFDHFLSLSPSIVSSALSIAEASPMSSLSTKYTRKPVYLQRKKNIQDDQPCMKIPPPPSAGHKVRRKKASKNQQDPLPPTTYPVAAPSLSIYLPLPYELPSTFAEELTSLQVCVYTPFCTDEELAPLLVHQRESKALPIQKGRKKIQRLFLASPIHPLTIFNNIANPPRKQLAIRTANMKDPAPILNPTKSLDAFDFTNFQLTHDQRIKGYYTKPMGATLCRCAVLFSFFAHLYCPHHVSTLPNKSYSLS